MKQFFCVIQLKRGESFLMGCDREKLQKKISITTTSQRAHNI